jgi:hypothetical protein
MSGRVSQVSNARGACARFNGNCRKFYSGHAQAGGDYPWHFKQTVGFWSIAGKFDVGFQYD